MPRKPTPLDKQITIPVTVIENPDHSHLLELKKIIMEGLKTASMPISSDGYSSGFLHSYGPIVSPNTQLSFFDLEKTQEASDTANSFWGRVFPHTKGDKSGFSDSQIKKAFDDKDTASKMIDVLKQRAEEVAYLKKSDLENKIAEKKSVFEAFAKKINNNDKISIEEDQQFLAEAESLNTFLDEFAQIKDEDIDNFFEPHNFDKKVIKPFNTPSYGHGVQDSEKYPEKEDFVKELERSLFIVDIEQTIVSVFNKRLKVQDIKISLDKLKKLKKEKLPLMHLRLLDVMIARLEGNE
jgi:hypothetical protein